MSAEINPSYYRLAQERLVNQVLTIDLWDLADKHQE